MKGEEKRKEEEGREREDPGRDVDVEGTPSKGTAGANKS